jgi:protein gp37
MADRTAIEWTDATWNPVTGCTKVSAGCDHCYAERFSERFRGVPGHPFENGFDLTLRPERLEQPLRWKAPRMIFVNSMSDLFHKDIPYSFVDAVFDTMERANWHQYQVLTKRSSRLRDYVNRRYREGVAPGQIWLGTSIEDQAALIRLRHLKAATAAVRFISFEPLLGPIGEVDLTGIHWVIAGGESGHGARPVQIEWLRSIRDQCREKGVAFYFKQWGGSTPKSGGHTLDRRTWRQFPKTSSVTGGGDGEDYVHRLAIG